ncbi:Uncharacterised protein [Halioglobus japonicus]|nr:Uncharacterised protein [Halioglobus japonicus]CAA0125174.1 Uncharacterised protein [Halioglobus japonicus]
MVGPTKPTAAQSGGCEDTHAAQGPVHSDQCNSSTYKLAYTDEAFMERDELLSVRLQLELLKPDVLQDEYGIHSTVVIFGSSRIPDFETATKRLQHARAGLADRPDDAALARKVKVAERVVYNSRFYDEARELSRLITADALSGSQSELTVVTGGGPGIMEAANRGAMEAGGKSIGLNIVLPFEQTPNAFVTPELCFQFHYFAIRKMHFLKRAKALVACPGGFGTLDELFETLTLIQTHKMPALPVLLLGREFWERVIDFDRLVEEGVVAENDLSLFCIVDSAEEAWSIIGSSDLQRDCSGEGALDSNFP